ncbi:hypothetical protein L1049_021879 [Liquidambar formosana]|uniref:DUF4220 domain-containing protein n=1 Tax=Liquidambar formosana TaxID=63359 RepID=A0AAP0WQ02_LIQFO
MVAGITRSGERIRAVLSAKKFAHDLVNEKYNSVIIKVLHGNERRRNLPKIDFEAIDIELGFMYDKLYTKASIIYSWRGFLARLMSFICVVSVLLAFCIVSKDGYSNADINITYILLVGAVVLDIYAVILMLFSDWILVNWLKKHEKSFVSPILQALAQSPLIKKKRWSTSMVGFNLLHSCLYELKTTPFVRKFLECVGVDASQTIVDITKEETLKTMMLERVEAIASQSVELKPFYKRREWALFEDPEKTVLKDFDDSIIIWHIATDMCYYDSVSDAQNMLADVLSKTSKMLSDYMMYLVVKRPNMLPIVTWHSMYDTTRNFFKPEFQNRGRNWLLSIAEHQACKTLLEEAKNCSRRDLPAESALAHACDLARRLEACPDKWNIISDEWIEMLCYAANHCKVEHHMEELRRGGEFLTHVRLLLFNVAHKQKSTKRAIQGEILIPVTTLVSHPCLPSPNQIIID